jgi:hypothetical protein
MSREPRASDEWERSKQRVAKEDKAWPERARKIAEYGKPARRVRLIPIDPGSFFVEVPSPRAYPTGSEQPNRVAA